MRTKEEMRRREREERREREVASPNECEAESWSQDSGERGEGDWERRAGDGSGLHVKVRPGHDP